METGLVRPGQPAPPLELSTLAGGQFDLATVRGHAALVSFLRHAG